MVEPTQRPPREIVRRDGTRERFDPGRLAASIHRAAIAVGQGELLLAEELAALVSLVLEEEYGDLAPSTRALRESAERVLMETGHHEVARSYILAHAHVDAAEPAGERERGEPPGAVRVASLGRECLEAFDAAKVAATLMLDLGITNTEANAIAAAVERQVGRLASHVVAAATVRQLQACELLERGRGDLVARIQGLGIPPHEVEAVAFARAGGDRPEVKLGEELMRRYSLVRLLDPGVVEAHLSGDLHVDGLSAPGRALQATLDFGEVRRAAMPGALAALLHVVHGLEGALQGPLTLVHVERALAPSFGSSAEAEEAARTLLLALADAPTGRHRNAPPRRVLGVGADLPPKVATALFRRGGEPNSVRGRLHAFVVHLLEQAVAFSTHLRVPRVRVLVNAGEEERELVAITAALQPALALGVAEVGRLLPKGPTVRVVGARIALNIARAALRVGRRRERDFLAALPGLVERGVSAATNVLRHLLQRDDADVGFLRRLRELTRDVARDLPLELPGSHGYHVVVTPVGVDAAVRAITERDPAESEAAARLRELLLSTLRSALPEAGGTASRFELLEEPFPEAELRFGRQDFLAFPRGHDLLGLAHDGAAFRYSFDPSTYRGPSPWALATAAGAGSSSSSSSSSAGSVNP